MQIGSTIINTYTNGLFPIRAPFDAVFLSANGLDWPGSIVTVRWMEKTPEECDRAGIAADEYYVPWDIAIVTDYDISNYGSTYEVKEADHEGIQHIVTLEIEVRGQYSPDVIHILAIPRHSE